jgi:hypothetical protein
MNPAEQQGYGGKQTPKAERDQLIGGPKQRKREKGFLTKCEAGQGS